MQFPDKFTIKTFFFKAMDEYVGAIEQYTDLFQEEKSPETQEYVFAQTRLRAATEKLEFVINISKVKYKVDLGVVPPFLRRGGTA